MQFLSISEASSESLPELLEKARQAPVIIAEGKDGFGAIVSMEDYDIIRKYRAERLLESMDALGAAMRDEAAKAGISLEDLEKMLDRHDL